MIYFKTYSLKTFSFILKGIMLKVCLQVHFTCHAKIRTYTVLKIAVKIHLAQNQLRHKHNPLKLSANYSICCLIKYIPYVALKLQ